MRGTTLFHAMRFDCAGNVRAGTNCPAAADCCPRLPVWRSKRRPGLSVSRGVIAHESCTNTPSSSWLMFGADRRVVDRHRVGHAVAVARDEVAVAERVEVLAVRRVLQLHAGADLVLAAPARQPRQHGAPGAALLVGAHHRRRRRAGQRRLRDVHARQRVGREVGLVVERPGHVVPGEAGVEQQVGRRASTSAWCWRPGPTTASSSSPPATRTGRPPSSGGDARAACSCSRRSW